MLYAIDFTTLPGMNQAFLFSLFLSIALTLVAIPYGKRRPKGSPLSWGEAMLSSVYVFGTMFVAYGIVPDRWLQHANTDLKWSKQRLLNGPFDILKAKTHGGHFPFTLSYQEVRDVVVIVIYAFFFALQVFIWIQWQNRGKKTESTEIETSTYGRPLVKKA